MIVTPNENTEIECAMQLMSLAAPAVVLSIHSSLLQIEVITFSYEQLIMSHSVFELWLIVRV